MPVVLKHVSFFPSSTPQRHTRLAHTAVSAKLHKPSLPMTSHYRPLWITWWSWPSAVTARCSKQEVWWDEKCSISREREERPRRLFHQRVFLLTKRDQFLQTHSNTLLYVLLVLIPAFISAEQWHDWALHLVSRCWFSWSSHMSIFNPNCWWRGRWSLAFLSRWLITPAYIAWSFSPILCGCCFVSTYTFPSHVRNTASCRS